MTCKLASKALPRLDFALKRIEKDLDTMDFKVKLSVINDIELNSPREILLNLNNDKIVDLEVVI